MNEIDVFLRTMLTTFLAICAPVVIIAMFAAGAHAQGVPTQSTGGVDFTPFLQQVIGIVAIVLTAAAGIVTKFLTSWLAAKTKMTDNQFEALFADRLNDIIHRAIDAGEVWAKQQVADKNSPFKNVQFNNFLVEYIMKTVMGNAPDILSYFNITEDRLKTMIVSRLNSYLKTPVADAGEVEFVTGSRPVTSSGAAGIPAA